MPEAKGVHDPATDLSGSESQLAPSEHGPSTVLASDVLQDDAQNPLIKPYAWVAEPSSLNEELGLASGDYHSENQPQRDTRFNSRFWQDADPRPQLIELFREAVNRPRDQRLPALLSIMGAVESDENWAFKAGIKLTPPLQGMTEINIVGLGISGADQVSVETDYILRHSRHIFYLAPVGSLTDYLGRVCSSVVNLGAEAYVEGGERAQAYRAMAARVVNAAIDEAPVAFALYGHPLVFSDPPFLVRRLAKLAGLRVQLRPAISSIDTLFSDLWLDPSSSGLLMYDATDAVIARRKFLPDVATLVLQIGVIGTSLYSQNPSRPQRFDAFVQHLKNFYPPNHVVFAVATARDPLASPRIIEFEIEEMPKWAGEINIDYLLYIPPVREHGAVDSLLLSQLTSAVHLGDITVQDQTHQPEVPSGRGRPSSS